MNVQISFSRFPRLRATSLDTAEGEGDQLDVKSLQNQLEKTQELVGNLSKQLMELKDQVRKIWLHQEAPLTSKILSDDGTAEAEATTWIAQSSSFHFLPVWQSIHVAIFLLE